MFYRSLDCNSFVLSQVWEHYQQKELIALVDESLEGNYDAEEACRFLKIGLLCTQDGPKLRPAMSTVVKMLMGEMSIDEVKITAPGLISDLFDVRIGNPQDNNNAKVASTDKDLYSSSDSMNNTTFSSGASTSATMTFTAVYDRSI